MDQQAFPVLGTPSTFATTQVWGPPQPSIGPLTQASLRPGALDVVGAQHPRNLFAKKPYTQARTATSTVVAQAQEGVIDWNRSGMPAAVMQTIVQSPQAAAHLGPYSGSIASRVPLDVLRVQNAASQAQYQQFTPTNSQQLTQPRPVQVPAARTG